MDIYNSERKFSALQNTDMKGETIGVLDDILPEFNEFRGVLSKWMKAVAMAMDELQEKTHISWRGDAGTVEVFAEAYAKAIQLSGLPLDETLMTAIELTNQDAADIFGREQGGLIPVSRNDQSDSTKEDEFPQLSHTVQGNDNRKKALTLIIGAIRTRIARAKINQVQ